MRVAIIEDSEIDRLNLKTLLEDFPDLELAGEAETLEAAVKLIDREKPDAVFLDIHLGRQKGFKALEQARHRPQVVITTSHPHYAVKGFEIAAADFLLKPVEEAALARAVGRLRQRIGTGGATARLDAADMLAFKDASGLHFMPVEQVQAVVGERIYTGVYVRDGRNFLHNRPLREWRDILPEKLFKALDRSTIVNLREIHSLKENAECAGVQVVFKNSDHALCLGEAALKTLHECFKG